MYQNKPGRRQSRRRNFHLRRLLIKNRNMFIAELRTTKPFKLFQVTWLRSRGLIKFPA